MSTERIRHLARTLRTALAADGASPSPPPSTSPSRSTTGREAVVDTGSRTPWTGEMAAPSFMILVAGPRR
ncbi:hypothetical protein [Streptomyces sp. AP-93]|uniref:hypothetical protein n=1 Tax=Streptomyces sp. AP-93 TaxID=2929048 RepID=UPI001FAFEE8C|nr:hypothetical protein [Streptomyces sp. AP-93]MCJ0869282.1 hypothetical protein [Streptomyces sp. AP-93]